jgi:ADP-heptose:LPS heptosyltransferase
MLLVPLGKLRHMGSKNKRKPDEMPLTIPDCKKFSGYKPCFPGSRCYIECEDMEPIGKRILIINLDAMGNVLVTLSILPSLKRKYPASHITWITLKNAAPLLHHILEIDRIMVWEPESWLILQQLRFDLVLNVDKSLRSGALAGSIEAEEKRGFGVNSSAKIIPLNREAYESYILGLDDQLKFHVNDKSVPQILHEQFGLPFERKEYRVVLSRDEEEYCRRYASDHGIAKDDFVVGLNTGCSELFPNKKMTIDQHIVLIRHLAEIPGVRVLLLGGPEDTMRNAELARQAGDLVVNTPTTEGVRRGLCYINVADCVVSGDSFGMHAANALGKYIVVWFGVSCAAEIDLFERGKKIIPRDLACSPCWKRECPYNLECIELIDLDEIFSTVLEFRSRAETRNTA